MPHLMTTLMRTQLHAVKSMMKPEKLQSTRALQDKLGELMARVHSSRITLFPIALDGFQGCWALPTGSPRRGMLLYVHGGGYTAGDLPYATGFGSVLADQVGRPVFCPAYRLAPEHPFPAAAQDALAAYRYLLEQGIPGQEIILCGESAGGGLIVSLALQIKEAGLPMPAGMVPISPWVDLTLSGASYTDNKQADPCLTRELLAYDVEVYAGTNARHPLASPIFGDLTGLPPALIYAGGDELLLSDAHMLQGKLLSCGVPARLVVEEGLWHAYVLYGVKEARDALEGIAAFVEETLA
nr:alpha/beta hydrolase [bacterium]